MTLDIATAYKYVNLQMAAEALYDFNAVENGLTLLPGETTPYPTIPEKALTDGNFHASKFTTTQAAEFSKEWTVIEHKSDTTTGFSGTLFQNNVTKEFVLSLRSTEFIDDSARDNKETNELEISKTGWAMGQITDMEEWYKSSLKEKIGNNQLSVTGYSLGGHLATAFNLLHQGDTTAGGQALIKEVVTFNGAGVGSINGLSTLVGTAGKAALQGMESTFNTLYTSAEDQQKTAYLQDLSVADASGQ